HCRSSPAKKCSRRSTYCRPWYSRRQTHSSALAFFLIFATVASIANPSAPLVTLVGPEQLRELDLRDFLHPLQRLGETLEFLQPGLVSVLERRDLLQGDRFQFGARLVEDR